MEGDVDIAGVVWALVPIMDVDVDSISISISISICRLATAATLKRR